MGSSRMNLRQAPDEQAAIARAHSRAGTNRVEHVLCPAPGEGGAQESAGSGGDAGHLPCQDQLAREGVVAQCPGGAQHDVLAALSQAPPYVGVHGDPIVESEHDVIVKQLLLPPGVGVEKG